MFLAACLILAGLALFCALWLPGRRGARAEDREAALLALYRARRDELAAEATDSAVEAELHADLDAALLDDWREEDKASPSKSNARITELR